MRNLILILILLMPVMIQAQSPVAIPNSIHYGFEGAEGNGLKVDLLSLWELDGNTTTATDAHGSNDGTRNNGVLTEQTTVANLVYSNGFDGNNDYIGMGDVLDFDVDEPFSISAWIYLNANNINQYFVCKMLNSGTYRGWGMLVRSDNNLQIVLRSSNIASQRIWIVGNTNLTTGVWYHIGGSYNGLKNDDTSFEIYINGVKDTPYTPSNNTISSSTIGTAPLTISSRQALGSFFNGKIDQVGIWGAEKDQNSFITLHNSGSGLPYSNFTAMIQKLYDNLQNKNTFIGSRKYAWEYRIYPPLKLAS